MKDPNSARKTNWSILNLFLLCDEKIPNISFIVVSGCHWLFQIYLKKLSPLIHILLLSVPRLLTTLNYLLWTLKPVKG